MGLERRSSCCSPVDALSGAVLISIFGWTCIYFRECLVQACIFFPSCFYLHLKRKERCCVRLWGVNYWSGELSWSFGLTFGCTLLGCYRSVWSCVLEYRVGTVLLLHVSLCPRQGWVMSRRGSFGNCVGHLCIGGGTLFNMYVEEAFGSSEVGILIYCLSGTSHWQVFPKCFPATSRTFRFLLPVCAFYFFFFLTEQPKVCLFSRCFHTSLCATCPSEKFYFV